jgi:hypothetical protein
VGELTARDIESMCRTRDHWADLADALRPLTEAERAALVWVVTAVTDFERRREFDGSAVAMAAIGVLSDLQHLAIYGLYFPELEHAAEPYFLQVVRDRRPRWLGRLVKLLIRERWTQWRIVWLLVREGLVPRPASPVLLTGAVYGLAGSHLAGRARAKFEVLRDEPELIDEIVWPMLSEPHVGRLLKNHDTWHTSGQWSRPVDDTQTWIHALLDQVATGVMDRDRLLDVTLGVLLLDGPAVDQAWFLEFHEALGVAAEDVVRRMPTYLGLLGVRHGPAVRMAQDRLGHVAQDVGVGVPELVAASPAVLSRAEKGLVLRHADLLAAVADMHPEQVPAICSVLELAVRHPRRDVQERVEQVLTRLAPARAGDAAATDSARRGPAMARPVAVDPAPLAGPVLVEPVRTGGELVELLLRTGESPDAIAVERIYDGALRLGRQLSERERDALRHADIGGHLLGLAAIAQSLARNRGVAFSDDEYVGVTIWEVDRPPRYEPRWRMEHMVVRRGREVASHVVGGSSALLAFPSTTDGRVGVDDLERRLRSIPANQLLPLDAGLAALRVHPDDYAGVERLRGTAAGDAIAAGVRRLEAYDPAWARVAWDLPHSSADPPTVWQDTRSTIGSPHDLVAAVLDRFDMASRFAESLRFSGWAKLTTVMWPFTLPHHPELLAAHAHTRLVGALLPVILTSFDRNDSGSAPLLAGLAASRVRTGSVTASALVYGAAASAAGDRIAATDAVVELACHGLLDGGELGRQAALCLREKSVTGSRIADVLQEAAQALGPAAEPILDACLELLPVLPGRSDGHLYVDIVAELASALGRAVVLPGALRELAGGRSSSALARACRRVPTG